MDKTETIAEYQERLATIAAQEIQKEIDAGILLEILVEGGWIKIPYNYTDPYKAIEMTKYCEQTFKKNQWQVINGHFVFRKKKDAEWFILRWS